MAESRFLIEDQGGVTVAKFRTTSILDAITVDAIAADLYALVDGHEPRRVVLDFSDVSFMASRALGMLVTLHQKAEATRSEVSLARIRPELRKIFELTKLDDVYHCYDSVQKAVATFHESDFKSAVSKSKRGGSLRRDKQ